MPGARLARPGLQRLALGDWQRYPCLAVRGPAWCRCPRQPAAPLLSLRRRSLTLAIRSVSCPGSDGGRSPTTYLPYLPNLPRNCPSSPRVSAVQGSCPDPISHSKSRPRRTLLAVAICNSFLTVFFLLPSRFASHGLTHSRPSISHQEAQPQHLPT